MWLVPADRLEALLPAGMSICGVWATQGSEKDAMLRLQRMAKAAEEKASICAHVPLEIMARWLAPSKQPPTHYNAGTYSRHLQMPSRESLSSLPETAHRVLRLLLQWLPHRSCSSVSTGKGRP